MPNMQLLGLLLDYSESECKNTSETVLCKTIIDHLSTIHTISSTELASLSNTSTASVTRFIRNFPVKSYRSFTTQLSFENKSFIEARQRNSMIIERYGLEDIFEYEKNRGIMNLNENSISEQELDKLIQSIQYAKSITFIGASHSLTIFSKVQIALITKRKKAYIFKQESMLKEHLKHLGKDDLVIFISLQDRYQNENGNTHLDKLSERQVPCILLSQMKHEDEKKYKQVIYYGKNNDWNYGYYSMIVLSSYLEQLINKNL